jgi:hypothetical protein
MKGKGMGAASVALLIGWGAGGASARTHDHPPGHFTNASARVSNPWFPLRPGARYVYTGVREGKAARDVLTVTQATRVVRGVRCVVVRDRLYLRGKLSERTIDWYAQDDARNVWYFGEATGVLGANGRVTSTEGSWLAGRDGARAGIYMPGHPAVGQSGRQEFYTGHAEDHFKVLSLSARVSTPAVSSRHALLTKEWTPLEPGVVDHKHYARGVGTVLEEAVKGGTERLKLVSFDRG